MAVIRALFDSVFGKVKPLDKKTGHTDQILHLFAVPCGDCNGCVLEVMALRGAAFDISASGLVFVDHPAIANILLISGVLTRSMIPYLEKNWELMPEPKAIVSIGSCAINQGVFEENYAVLKESTGGEDCILEIEGCPPAPQQIMEGLLGLLGLSVQVDLNSRPHHHLSHLSPCEEPQHLLLINENSDSLKE
ncbi:NADH-ubiquinone oxidoreductase 20 kDa subunit [Commensalibacter papalotli (ex Servin-Garciduenas et al. 2014)]|uniref:NADH-ubiquinone oxidoreductase 20 kDa subunit n=1 Tax=Commensalibacter papalotli (ex Servin-Garciduenas et al. 2014) TaxID=1208583 RepID=W7DVJ5_9PROT|nr:NADH-ubiquinone oxidoreductase 20 kDa subunit [Commensalibacter papalotli (ex Servin-Garciduenas et al. 2014)]